MFVINDVLNYMYGLPIFGELIKEVFHHYPIFGLLGVAIIAFILINGILKRNLDVNLYKKMVNSIQNTKSKNKYDLERDRFYDGSTTPEFVEWQNQILKKIYSDYDLLSLFDKVYPIVINEAKENFTYPFKENLSKFSKLNNTTIPKFELDKGQQFYLKMMGPTIKWPDLIGFETEEFILDEENKIEGFSARVCQYKHTVVTSHILDYELYKSFRKRGKQLIEKTSDEILNILPYRKKVHNGKTQTEVITTGCNRHSLLSVQMLVVYFDEYLEDYRVLVFKRSKDVAIKPNYWQLIPAGGFEIFEQQETTNPYIIRQNFDVGLALFRELVEEVFNGKDFQNTKTGEVNEFINKHKDVVQIKEWLKTGEAALEFVGNVVDLVSLRPELSFLLVIDNPEFGKKNFKINHEGKDLQTIKVNDLPHMLEGELLYPSSAGLLKLAMKSKLFKERGLLQED